MKAKLLTLLTASLVLTAAPTHAAPPPPDTTPQDGAKHPSIYWIDLSGEFGQDISESPIRSALKDAHKNKADVVIFKLNADYKVKDGITDKDLPNDASHFDGLFRAEKIKPIFTTELPTEWGNDPKPRLVFWVKQAMAGAAFLPLVSKEIYFTTDARMGGIGDLATIFQGVGDPRVQEKQRALRLAMAEGWANVGGYDPRIIRAMARVEDILSVRYTNGTPELFESLPTSPGEELLTDEHDALTLSARTARIVGISKGTADSQDELLALMQLDRTGVNIQGRSKQVMQDWSRGLDTAKHRIRAAMDDYRAVRVQPPGDYDARTKARGQRKRHLIQLKSLIKQWGEGLDPWLREHDVPPIPDIDSLIETIDIEQLRDKR